MEVLKQVLRKEGPLGLYAGMESTFWRYIDANSTQSLTTLIHLASDRYTGTEDISVAFIRLKCYFQNLMSVLRFPPSEIDLKFIISAEPTSATYEQLRVWCHRWFCRYRFEYTVSHLSIAIIH